MSVRRVDFGHAADLPRSFFLSYHRIIRVEPGLVVVAEEVATPHLSWPCTAHGKRRRCVSQRFNQTPAMYFTLRVIGSACIHIAVERTSFAASTRTRSLDQIGIDSPYSPFESVVRHDYSPPSLPNGLPLRSRYLHQRCVYESKFTAASGFR